MKVVEKYNKIKKEMFQNYILQHKNLNSRNWLSWISSHPILNDREFLEKQKLKTMIENETWDWNYISWNANITEDFVLKHKDKPFDFYFLTDNKAISVEFILKTMDILNWSIECISSNPNMTNTLLLKIMKHYPRISEDLRWESLTTNEGISIDFIFSNRHLPWAMYEISSRKDITYEVVCKYNTFAWNWKDLCRFSKIDVDILKKYNFEETHANSNLSVYDIHDMNPELLSVYCNPLKGGKERFLKEYIAVGRISRWFCDCYWMPQYPLCRKRLEKEYNEYKNKVLSL